MTPEDRKGAEAAGKHNDAMSPRLDIYASAGLCTLNDNSCPQPAAGAAAPVATPAEPRPAEEEENEAQRRLERLRVGPTHIETF